MQALRQRASCVARRAKPSSSTPRNSRSYASESHGHDHHHAAPEVNEGLGTGFYIFAAAVPLSYAGYAISRPGPNGEPSSVEKWLRGFESLNDTWAERNDIRTRLIEQAAHDKHLFFYAGRSTHVELKMPELIGHASPHAIPAGHLPNLDHVTEHYRQKYAEVEEKKAKKLLARAEAEAEARKLQEQEKQEKEQQEQKS